MSYVGGCYCGAIRYECDGDAVMKAQCHCRECQYVSGGGPNYFMMMPAEGFRWTGAAPAQFTRSDLDRAVTREFCGTCGTHVLTRLPDMPLVVLKVGSLDDPAQFTPRVAIYTVDSQPFHQVPEGMPCFERLPPRKG